MEKLLQDAGVKPVYLVEITAGRQWVWWESDGAGAYVTPETGVVLDVRHNGTRLITGTSVANVRATDGSWYSDGTNVYVRLASASDPNLTANVVQGTLAFYFSNHGKTINNRFYDGRITDLPKLSMRVEQKFTGVGQIGGGSISLSNMDGYFDSFSAYQWDAGKTTLWLGADNDNYTMPFGQYLRMATWVNDAWTRTNQKFTVQLKEIKSKLQKKVPTSFYERTTYPNMAEGDVGKPIQIAYGKLVGVSPVVINAVTKRFKVAGHAIKSFDDVKISGSAGWQQSSFASVDTSTGEFTLGSDWDGQASVSVDFTGKTKTNGYLMNNASDIVKDLLAYAGETFLDESAFTESVRRLEVGYQNNNVLDRVCIRTPSLYISETSDLFEIISEINKLVGSYLFVDRYGRYVYRVFEPIRGEGLPQFDQHEFFTFEEMTEQGREYSKAVLTYANRSAEDFAQSVTFTQVKNQYIRDENAPVIYEGEVKFYSTSEARNWGEKLLVMEGNPGVTYKATIKWRGLLFQPSDQIHVRYARFSPSGAAAILDKVLEILEVNINLSTGKVDLLLGNLHGWEGGTGFWVNDSDVVPSRFANEAGYAAGVLAWNGSESADLRAWKAQNSGFWTDPNGFSLVTDRNSHLKSRWF